MKYLVFIAVLITTSAPSFASNTPTQIIPHAVAKTPIEKLQLRMRQQVAQIQRDARFGKLTKDQAKSLKVQVEAVRQQEITDLKQNGTKTLTDTQISQLNVQLNTLSKTIPIK